MLSQAFTVAQTRYSLDLAYTPSSNSSFKELLLALKTFSIENLSLIPNSYMQLLYSTIALVYLCIMIINS